MEISESKTQRKKRLNQEQYGIKNSYSLQQGRYYKLLLGVVILLVGGIVIANYFKPFSTNNSAQPNDVMSKEIAQEPKLTIYEDDWSKGAEDATVILTEYLDFECEACGAYYPLLKEIYQEFSGDIKIIARYFPLPGHPNSSTAAYTVQAAGQQGKFWEMHDLLFETQNQRGHKPSADQKQFIKYAQQLGLNIDKFNKDIASSTVKTRVMRDKQEGERLGIRGTPAFFINGQRIDNPKSIEDFKTLIKAELLKNPKKPKGEKVHEHADFKLFINNTEYSLNGDKYQSTTGEEHSRSQHLHDNNGGNIHKHLTRETIADFLQSLNIKLTNNCLTLDNGQTYCNSNTQTLKFFVNDKSVTDFIGYEFNDLDRILISYGSETQEQIQTQLNAVTDMSCMYSDKCPERGKPPTETCVVGLGGEC